MQNFLSEAVKEVSFEKVTLNWILNKQDNNNKVYFRMEDSSGVSQEVK